MDFFAFWKALLKFFWCENQDFNEICKKIKP